MENKVKVNVAGAPWEVCQCGGRTFESVFMFKRISPLVSPNGQELHIPLEVFRCTECKKFPKFMHDAAPDIPEDLKATSIKNSCNKCIGTGQIDCPGCEGSGEANCAGCTGTGKRTCGRCGGSGQS